MKAPSNDNLQPDLSIIIVNWNAKEMLRNCLNSILQANNNFKIQIIVVDNASSDGSKEMVESFFTDVKILESGGNLGFSRANNLGIPYAEAPYILFLNPDTLVSGAALSGMTEFLMENPSVGALGCKICNAAHEIQDLPEQWWISPSRKLVELLLTSRNMPNRIKNVVPYHDPNKSGYISYLYGACLMVRRSTLDQVGPFDNRFFMYCEDIDLCHRISMAGWKLYYLSEYQITHLVGGPTKVSATNFKYITSCESISKLMQKYYGNRGKGIYKFEIFLISFLKLCLLPILLAFRLVKFNVNLREFAIKHYTCIKWSISSQNNYGLKR
jgi:GT2 family glycosyltransferase